jgi:hypothetical protein
MDHKSISEDGIERGQGVEGDGPHRSDVVGQQSRDLGNDLGTRFHLGGETLLELDQGLQHLLPHAHVLAAQVKLN